MYFYIQLKKFRGYFIKMQEISTYMDVKLPVLPLRALVAFPAVQLNIEIARPISLKAFTVPVGRISESL